MRMKKMVVLISALLAGLSCCAGIRAEEEVQLYYVPRGAVEGEAFDFANAVPVAVGSSEEQIAFSAINQFRAQHGLPALQHAADLSQASREWSRTMRRTGFRHGSGAENIAMNHLRGAESARRVVEQWKNSSGHRAFLLSRNITEAGIGYDEGYWTFRGRSGERSRTVTQPQYKQTSDVAGEGTHGVSGQVTRSYKPGVIRRALR